MIMSLERSLAGSVIDIGIPGRHIKEVPQKPGAEDGLF
jgi:hypothetical protein